MSLLLLLCDGLSLSANVADATERRDLAIVLLVSVKGRLLVKAEVVVFSLGVVLDILINVATDSVRVAQLSIVLRM